MSWLLAFVGFAALIVLHEAGHAMAAKAVGMRVERFSLFFPPLLARVRRGETEYAIGAVPLGGYVKITGMNPREELDPEVAPRAYFRQPPWKRIVVIAAGPAVNIAIAFLILWALFLSQGQRETIPVVQAVEPGQPAAGVLRPGDRLLAVDGRRGSPRELGEQIASHRCAGPGRPVDGCNAQRPARLTIERAGERRTLTVTPRYDAAAGPEGRPRVGFAFDFRDRSVGPIHAARVSTDAMWRVTKATVSALVRVFDPERRRELSGVVGSYEVTRQSFDFDAIQAFNVLAIISLSLAIVNLFPFLPLDGGHIFWALAEKVRGRAVPFSVMERAGALGFLLVIMIFVIGLSNDIDRLRGEGFGVR